MTEQEQIKKLQEELGIEDELIYNDGSDLRWLKMIKRMDGYRKDNVKKTLNYDKELDNQI